MENKFLPVSRREMEERGWDQVDFVYISGDAYVDHPSFGHAIITRLLEAHGYRVGIIAQPDWKDKNSITVFGEPRLAFLVSAGNMDSMVNHYSVSKKRRSQDAYTPGGVMGKRPDYACVVYGNLIRQTYKKTPVILGGIEASLRRLAHYDYWSDRLKRSVLLDSGADLISYGMGERSIVEIADALNAGIRVEDLTYIDGTVCKVKDREAIYDAVELPAYSELQKDRLRYAESFYTQYCNTDPFTAKRLIEPYSEHVYVVQNPPAKPLSQTEMDDVYALPYMRTYHPMYEKDGGIPAISETIFPISRPPLPNSLSIANDFVMIFTLLFLTSGDRVPDNADKFFRILGAEHFQKRSRMLDAFAALFVDDSPSFLCDGDEYAPPVGGIRAAQCVAFLFQCVQDRCGPGTPDAEGARQFSG